ncbi:MAG TPA: 4-hydroxyphenylacetate decarboxylase small subunit [Elusimicrobiales bacterium]|nr:4-hydroxyphenylacetate decarboxylase small subunit [Elusimicrobiales bacterium]
MQKEKCRDCKNYAPVDVVKGICHITKKLIQAEGEICKEYLMIAKCKNCKNYSPDDGKEDIGICKISKNKFMAYGDMISVTCTSYAEK